MDKKWCLLKKSDGTRGEADKKKIYEVIVLGNQLHTSWGMAEKTSRQHATQNFANAGAASQAAHTKIVEKLARGYEIAYTV
jgi:predicted DNA-binding WGR domain protein